MKKNILYALMMPALLLGTIPSDGTGWSDGKGKVTARM